MNRKFNFVLILVLSFGFVAACQAMGKLNTQDAETTQEVVQEVEKAVAVEAYSAPVDVEEVEDSMKMDADSIQEVAIEPEVVVEMEVAIEPEVVEGLSVIEGLGILDEFKVLAGTGEKVSFLLAKANEFYSSEQFQKAVDAAQYVLQYLDADSQEAKDLLTKAKDAIAQAAAAKVDEAKTGISETLGLFDE